MSYLLYGLGALILAGLGAFFFRQNIRLISAREFYANRESCCLDIVMPMATTSLSGTRIIIRVRSFMRFIELGFSENEPCWQQKGIII